MTNGRKVPADGLPGRLASVAEDPPHILLRRMAHGDESALATLYERWANRVHVLISYILQDSDDVDEVVGETFWQAWRSASEYDERRGTGSTWLLMIARTRALDRLRARRRERGWITAPLMMQVLLDDASARQIASPADHVEGLERDSALASALRAIPIEQREALELAFFGGFTHEEIAERTRQPLGTVKTRIRLALQKLRDRLAFLHQEGP